MSTPLEMIMATVNPKGEKQRKRNMQKRHERFREIEAALPEAQRLMNRTDFDKHVTPFKCPTCGVYQESKNALDNHVSSCKKEASLLEAEQEHSIYLTRQATFPCEWVLDSERTRCGKIFDDELKLVHHVMQHTSKDSKETCKYGDCSQRLNAEGFATREDWNSHLADEHGLATMKPGSLKHPAKENATYMTDVLASTKPTPKRVRVRGKTLEAVKAATKSAESASVDSADKEEDSDDEPLVRKRRRVL
jgi:hypothetical protein